MSTEKTKGHSKASGDRAAKEVKFADDEFYPNYEAVFVRGQLSVVRCRFFITDLTTDNRQLTTDGT